MRSRTGGADQWGARYVEGITPVRVAVCVPHGAEVRRALSRMSRAADRVCRTEREARARARETNRVLAGRKRSPCARRATRRGPGARAGRRHLAQQVALARPAARRRPSRGDLDVVEIQRHRAGHRDRRRDRSRAFMSIVPAVRRVACRVVRGARSSARAQVPRRARHREAHRAPVGGVRARVCRSCARTPQSRRGRR